MAHGAGIIFDIIHQDGTGYTGRYCRIQRTSDMWWWDNINKVFLATASANSDISMLETVEELGKYYGTTSTIFANGVYTVNLYDSLGNLLINGQKSYKSYDKTLLQMVNDVRRKMRFEQVTDLTDPFSVMIVDWLNQIQLDYMQEDAVWPELRMVSIATSIADLQLYQLNPPNMGEFDFIYRLYEYPGGFQLQPFGEHETIGAIANPGRPLYYNVQYHTENIPTVFISPDPVEPVTYLIEFYIKPKELVSEHDIPDLHHAPIILGAYALALESQGNDNTMAWNMFQYKLKRLAESEADIWLDSIEVTPV